MVEAAGAGTSVQPGAAGALAAAALPPWVCSRVEDAGLNASAPPQQRWIDGWLVRYCPAKAQRARCIHALADGRLSLDERLALCRTLYAEHRLPLVVRITPFTRPPELDEALVGRGFARHDESLVMVLPQIPPGPEERPAPTVRLQSVSAEAYAHIVGEFRGTPMPGRIAHAQRIASSPVPYTALLLRDTAGAVLAGAQAAREGDLVGLYDVFTAPAQRGQGFAGLLCRQLLAAAREAGARIAYLQVDAGNDPALALYRRLGFVEAYRYHYRSPPASPA